MQQLEEAKEPMLAVFGLRRRTTSVWDIAGLKAPASIVGSNFSINLRFRLQGDVSGPPEIKPRYTRHIMLAIFAACFGSISTLSKLLILSQDLYNLAIILVSLTSQKPSYASLSASAQYHLLFI